jgi:Concanavalin A-like lectin/glucanases superfamily
MWAYDNGGVFIGRMYNGAILPKKWYHVVGVYDGGTAASSIKIYLNGVQVDDADSVNGTIASITTTHFRIGLDSSESFSFPGKIDDPRQDR